MKISVHGLYYTLQIYVNGNSALHHRQELANRFLSNSNGCILDSQYSMLSLIAADRFFVFALIDTVFHSPLGS